MRLTHYTVASNGCLYHFPNNSLTKFSNVVPQVFHQQRGGEKLFVRLRSIAISYKLTEPDIFAGYAKIHLSELEPTSLNTVFEKSLGRFPFPPKTVLRDYAIHEFENSTYIPIRALPLAQLSILITNSADRQLQLADGPPTLVQLEVTNMDLSGQFSISCMSHSPRELEIYPENTLDEFRVRLPQELSLRDWEVSLVSVGYPPDLDPPTTVWWTAQSTIAGKKRRLFSFDLLDFDTTGNFVRAVIRELEADDYYGGKLEIEMLETPTEYGFFNWRTQNISFAQNEEIEVNFSLGFCRAFGQTTQPPPTSLGLRNAVTMHGQADIKLAVPTSIGMLYCDVVESSAVSDGLAPLLQVMPVNHLSGNHLYEPQHLIFHQVVTRSFSDITFRLKRPDGQPHRLNSQSEYTIASGGLSITLLFRPISRGKSFQCERLGHDDC